MDDPSAIAACQAGNADAFGHLVERYEAEAFGHALAILAHREDAADAVQDSFVRAYRALERFEAGRPFYPWFYTILRRQCYKTAARRPHAAGADEPGLELLAVPEPAVDAQARRLDQGLRALAPEDRELITLKHLDQLSYDELARRLQIPPGTVMSRLYHARRRLRDILNRLTRHDP